jgi:hypothetical protein
MDQVKIATITIGSYEPPLIVDLAHNYYYPENVTEWELAEELSNLVECYERVVYPIDWPPHLRGDKIIAWAEGCQEGTQCNMFCKNYEKGCTLYATK